MAQKIYIKDENIGLGVFSLPILTFNERMESLRQTNPDLKTEQERAAVVYFGMLAEQPKPSRTDNVIKLVYFDNIDFSKWLDLENELRYSALGWYRANVHEFTDDAQAAYLTHVNKLQEWIIKNGLWDGIQKTLNEQSRQRQKEAANAGYGAQVAAARKAAELAEMNAATTEEAREYAAEKVGEAEKELQYNLKHEAEIKEELLNIEQGLPADFGKDEKPGISWPLVIAGGAVLLLLLRGRK